MSEATTAAPLAIASSSTTPNDSPSIAGKQARVAARSRRAFSSSLDTPEPLDVRELAVAQVRGLRSFAHDPQGGVALEPGERVEQDRETLARLVAADERDHRSERLRPRVGEREVGDLDAVGHDLAVGVERELHLARRLVGHCGRDGEPAQHGPETGTEGVVPPVAPRTRRVEGADGRHGGPDQRGVIGARCQRLVQVEDVGTERPDRLERAAGELHDRWRSAPPTRCSGPACSGRR